jgi:Flp pilus assembly protein TadB
MSNGFDYFDDGARFEAYAREVLRDYDRETLRMARRYRWAYVATVALEVILFVIAVTRLGSINVIISSFALAFVGYIFVRNEKRIRRLKEQVSE